MYRSILLHVETAAPQRIAAAIDLAKTFDGTLIGLAAGLPQLPIEVSSAALGVVSIGADYTVADRKVLEADLKQAEAVFRQMTEAAGVKTEWRVLLEGPAAAITNAAAAADIVVVGPGNETLLGDFDSPSPGDVVLHTGRPVLLVPKDRESGTVKSAVVAWKNASEAQRALADAVPLLKSATGGVTIVVVKEGQATPDATDPKLFLSRHGIDAKVEVLSGGGSASEQITGYAKSTGADLIVAGAYGHTRLREWIFGGVTRGLLSDPPCLCLFAH